MHGHSGQEVSKNLDDYGQDSGCSLPSLGLLSQVLPGYVKGWSQHLPAEGHGITFRDNTLSSEIKDKTI